MAEEIRIWRIRGGNQLQEISRSKLDLEERLEDWLSEDVSILSKDLLIIGRQIQTEAGQIDLLCLNPKGDLVVVELKRQKTPREVTAQALDYASCVRQFSREAITDIANGYLSSRGLTLEEAFNKKFCVELPEVLNESHSMMIVGSEIDDRSERIVKYLSDEYGVNINVARFQYFKTTDGDELLARIFLIEPSEVEIKSFIRGGTKRRPSLTEEELEEIARQNGVDNLYDRLVADLEKRFTKGRTLRSLRFFGHINESNLVIFSLLPPKSNSQQGLCFQIYLKRFMDYTGLDRATVLELLPAHKQEWTYQEGGGEHWSGYEGFFADIGEVEKFLGGMKHVVRH